MKKLALASVITLLLSGCGGGSDSSTQQAQTPSRVTGTIERVDLNNNTIEVNGYNFAVASVNYGDANLSLNELQPDMMVSIANNARAGAIVEMEPTIVGIISARNGDSFTVNGITLNFSGLSTEIDVNDWVMVSSLPTANNGYKVLSVVEFEAADLGNQIEVEGQISELTNTTFKLGAAITVDYSLANIEDNATLSDGQWVEVTGTGAIGAEFSASHIEVEDYDDLADDNEIEGVITWVNADKSLFELNRRGQFSVNGNTRFEDGSSDNLIAGTVIELTASNNIAIEIEFDDNDNDSDDNDWNKFEFEVTGEISNIDSSTDQISFEIKGNKITTDANTFYDDGLSADDLGQGGLFEVEGVIINGKNIAREIEREDNN